MELADQNRVDSISQRNNGDCQHLPAANVDLAQAAGGTDFLGDQVDIVS
jgi:hypothetical protein